MLKIESYGRIEKGKLSIIKRDLFTKAITTLTKGRYKIIIEKLYRKRSTAQNAYRWGVIYPEMLKGFQDIGYNEIKTVDQVHNFVKLHFLKTEIRNEKTGEVWQTIRSTTELTTIEDNELAEELRQFASEYFSINIPEPNEVMEELKL